MVVYITTKFSPQNSFCIHKIHTKFSPPNSTIEQRIAYSTSLYNANVSTSYKIDAFIPEQHTTKWMVNAIQTRVLNRFMSTKSGAHKAALYSQGTRNANAWLNAPMIHGYGLVLSNPEFRILCKRKLRHKLVINNRKCIACDELVDNMGDHGVICKHGTGIIYKHDEIVYGISTLLKSADIEHSIERRHLFDANNMKPADINFFIIFISACIAFIISAA